MDVTVGTDGSTHFMGPYPLFLPDHCWPHRDDSRGAETMQLLMKGWGLQTCPGGSWGALWILLCSSSHRSTDIPGKLQGSMVAWAQQKIRCQCLNFTFQLMTISSCLEVLSVWIFLPQWNIGVVTCWEGKRWVPEGGSSSRAAFTPNARFLVSNHIPSLLPWLKTLGLNNLHVLWYPSAVNIVLKSPG